MADALELNDLIEVWSSSIDDFVALVRALGAEHASVATDLPGWTVADIVAHTAHLEAIVAGASEETMPVPDGLPHVKNLVGVYTEQGVIVRRGRSLGEMTAEIEDSVARRRAQLRADPPIDGTVPAPRTPGGVEWDLRTLLSNRPIDVWVHEQDIRRAVGRPGGWDTRGAEHFFASFIPLLPMIWGKRVGAPIGSVLAVTVTDTSEPLVLAVGSDGRARFAPGKAPTDRVTLGREDFVVLCTGRRTAAEVDVQASSELAQQFLERLNVLF